MQNKKTLLQRLLVIYITFFIVLVASIAHSVLTDFTRGAAEGVAPGASPLSLAFRSIGGSGWLYALVLLGPLFYAVIIVLMFMIIHSLRRSIREERTLDRRNVWYLRSIGLLTIAAELIGSAVDWVMSRRAAELLAGNGYAVDTGFHVSYSMVIMGILILFAAEVFAIGQNLSEEQKLTI